MFSAETLETISHLLAVIMSSSSRRVSRGGGGKVNTVRKRPYNFTAISNSESEVFSEQLRSMFNHWLIQKVLLVGCRVSMIF